MKRASLATMAAFFAASFFLAACGHGNADPKAEAPPTPTVEHEQDLNVVQVDHPEQFPLATAVAFEATSQLNATGTISPDISRSVPVISIATGRVVEIKARLGDSVKKGQLLLRVQSADVSAAFSDYRKAVADEKLARIQFDRAKLLYDKGAISLNDFQTAEDVENKAQVDVENTTERLRVLGGSIDHPTAIVDIVAPVSGVITDQQVTNASGVAGLGSPNPFTISDLSNVWTLCDVYENDLANVHVGESADIRLNAYPDKVFTGRISNVGPVLDPTLRTAKVRIEVRNPGIMRFFFPRAEKRNAGRSSRVRHSAFARPRLGLCTCGRQQIPACGSGRRADPTGKHARGDLRYPTRRTGSSKCACVREHGGAVDDS